MPLTIPKPAVACPNCNADLCESGDVMLHEITIPRPDEHEALRDARCDLILECLECNARWNIFPRLQQFLDNPIAPGG